MRRTHAILATVLCCGTLAAIDQQPAAAAPGCATDSYEAGNDSLGQGAAVPVGGTVSRVICQDSSTGWDDDYFTFDAVGGKAYSLGVVSGGSGLGLGVLNGLLVAGVHRIEADGSLTTVAAPNSANPEANAMERFTTPVLPAGRYAFTAVDADGATDPTTFQLVPKAVTGSTGVYTVRLTEAAAPAPSVATITAPSTVKAKARTTGTLTLSGPAPEGGIKVNMGGRGGYVSVASLRLPAGTTRATFVIDVGSATKGTVLTVSATTDVGAVRSTTATVK